MTQFLPNNGEDQAAIKSLEDETPTGNPDESKLTCTETHIEDENGSTKPMTTTASRCQSEVQALKVSRTKEQFKETAVSDVSSTKHKAASEITSNKITAQHSTGEHMAVCLVGFISECGEQIHPATLMKETPLKVKDKMQEKKETGLTEKDRVEIEKKEATLKGNGKVKTEKEDLMEDINMPWWCNDIDDV